MRALFSFTVFVLALLAAAPAHANVVPRTAHYRGTHETYTVKFGYNGSTLHNFELVVSGQIHHLYEIHPDTSKPHAFRANNANYVVEVHWKQNTVATCRIVPLTGPHKNKATELPAFAQ